MSTMKIFDHALLRKVGTDLLVATGAPEEEARIVADELVEASLMGLDSHGVIRFVQYANDAVAGKIKPGAPITIVKETPTSAVVDCGFNFGPFTATRMVAIATEKARAAGMASVVSQNGQHVSRLGSYTQKLAQNGLFAFAVANSSKQGHWVVPWGGKDGRLATNPLSYAVPTGGTPIVMDMSTSMISEGKLRLLRNEGKPAPGNAIQDADGKATTDPNLFYGPPRGTIKPFGSEVGYKGFGLGLLVEILGGCMGGNRSSEDLPYVNGLFLLAIDPESLCGAERFRGLMDDLGVYMTSSSPAPGYREVIMPGALDFRTREIRLKSGVPLDEETWRQIKKTAQQLGVGVTL
ncbi:MAG: Ldh family oxidoreductase [Candidatus Latescibacterota bacterium]